MIRRRRAIGVALVIAGGLAAFATLVAIVARGRGISAARQPSAFETTAARATWRFLVPATARAAMNPVQVSADGLSAAAEHWADHCAICHAADGSGSTTIGRHVYPPVPDLRAPVTQRLTDGELFYAIEQGIPWTAMPAWGNGTAEGARESWALVRFIRHLPVITSPELEHVQQLMPKSPADARREQEIQDFLKAGRSKR